MAIRLDRDNYDRLLKKAEKLFYSRNYLEAFLVQSCLVEGVIKAYALWKFEVDTALEKRLSRFELSRILDELLLTKNIDKKLFDDLNIYRNNRNKVIHNLVLISEKDLEVILIDAYKSGKKIKGLVVDELRESFYPEKRSKQIDHELKNLRVDLLNHEKGSISEVRVQANIYKLLLEQFNLLESLKTLSEHVKIYPNFRKGKQSIKKLYLTNKIKKQQLK